MLQSSMTGWRYRPETPRVRRPFLLYGGREAPNPRSREIYPFHKKAPCPNAARLDRGLGTTALLPQRKARNSSPLKKAGVVPQHLLPFLPGYFVLAHVKTPWALARPIPCLKYPPSQAGSPLLGNRLLKLHVLVPAPLGFPLPFSFPFRLVFRGRLYRIHRV
ncbi:hypothetical protein Holit_02611 [Hollandina sp. SP2]